MKDRFQARGLKLTPQRIAILEYLEGNTCHPTAEEIFVSIKKKHPTISFSTVYNTVQALTDMGELTEVTIDPNRKHYDPDTKTHHHVICSGCGTIGDIFADFSAALKVPEEVSKEFTVTANHVNFYGTCRTCSASH